MGLTSVKRISTKVRLKPTEQLLSFSSRESMLLPTPGGLALSRLRVAVRMSARQCLPHLALAEFGRAEEM